MRERWFYLAVAAVIAGALVAIAVFLPGIALLAVKAQIPSVMSVDFYGHVLSWAGITGVALFGLAIKRSVIYAGIVTAEIFLLHDALWNAMMCVAYPAHINDVPQSVQLWLLVGIGLSAYLVLRVGNGLFKWNYRLMLAAWAPYAAVFAVWALVHPFTVGDVWNYFWKDFPWLVNACGLIVAMNYDKATRVPFSQT